MTIAIKKLTECCVKKLEHKLLWQLIILIDDPFIFCDQLLDLDDILEAIKQLDEEADYLLHPVRVPVTDVAMEEPEETKSAIDTDREPTPDERAGMAWWNRLSERERGEALDVATTADNPLPSPADAWATAKSRDTESSDWNLLLYDTNDATWRYLARELPKDEALQRLADWDQGDLCQLMAWPADKLLPVQVMVDEPD